MDSVLAIGAGISTPLMLAGFISAAFFLLSRLILKKEIFPALSRALSASIIRTIIERFFWLSLVAMILGFAGFAIGKIRPDVHSHRFSPPEEGMTRFVVERGDSYDFARDNKKSVSFSVKALPNTDGFTPLETTAFLVVADAASRKVMTYPMTLAIEPEGVPPGLKSYWGVEGLLPKDEFAKLEATQPSSQAYIKLHYDRDVDPKGMTFRTNIFNFNDSFIEEHTK